MATATSKAPTGEAVPAAAAAPRRHRTVFVRTEEEEEALRGVDSGDEDEYALSVHSSPAPSPIEVSDDEEVQTDQQLCDAAQRKLEKLCESSLCVPNLLEAYQCISTKYW
jgi:hypothetical protein